MTAVQTLTYVEIDVDYCALTYGADPCTAAIGVTGERKCFNTLSTCQDREHFDNAPVTLRFAKPAPYLPRNIETVAATVESVDYAPALISLGEDLGQRASLRVTFHDHPYSDTGPGGDKYVRERDYSPRERGTYWGKFRTRQNLLRGRPMRLIEGTVGQSRAEMKVRHFIVDSFDGPTGGKFTITAKDPLKMLDGDRALAPRPSRGYLAGAITAEDTEATLGPAGIGSTYPDSGKVAIAGKEIVSFSRSGDTLTFTGRGLHNTEATEHDAGDRCQLCLEYVAADPADVIHDLETNYVPGFDPAWITLVNWQAETGAYFRRVVTRLIAEPTPVKKLVNSLILVCGLAHWWNEEEPQMELRVLRAVSASAKRFDEGSIAGKLVAREQLNKRVSQVFVYFGQTNPLKGEEEPDNYRSTEIRVALDDNAEDFGSEGIKRIFAPWIPFGGLSVAQRTSALHLGRFHNPPRSFRFQVYRYGRTVPVLGEGCLLQSLPMQDATGALTDVPTQITRLHPRDATYEVEGEEAFFTDLDNENPTVHAVTIDVNALNVNARDLHDTNYASLSHGDTVNITVNAGVIVGSSSTAVASFIVGDWLTQAVTGNRTSGSPVITGLDVDTADWAAEGQRVFGTGIPAGAKILSVDSSSQITLDMNATSGSGTSTSLTVHTVIINLFLRGRVQGRGGNGGTYFSGAINGLPGGPALYTRYAVNLFLDVGDAEIWGGGGGGGAINAVFVAGNSGGGGAGSLPGVAGVEMDPPPWTPPTAATTEEGGIGGSRPSASQYAGNGGGPGLPGTAADWTGNPANEGAGGAAGDAIDGVSYVVKTGSGDIRGSEIN